MADDDRPLSAYLVLLVRIRLAIMNRDTAPGFTVFDHHRSLGAAARLTASFDKGCAGDRSDTLAKLGINAGSSRETKKRQNDRVPCDIKNPAKKPDAIAWAGMGAS
jgi:hypothetical protein